MPPPTGRAVDLWEIAAKIDRIYVALFEEVDGNPSLFTRMRMVEQRLADDDAEKKANRIVVAIGTLIGSAVGAAAAVVGMMGGHRQ